MHEQELLRFIEKRLPAHDKIERLRAAGMVADDEFVVQFADTLEAIRGAFGRTTEPRSRHWTHE